MLPREVTIENEARFLSPYARKSADTEGRDIFEPYCDIRTEFQRDRDRIIHSNSFRRLKHKTQVFLIPKSDHFRTRLTHTLEVAQIARTIARALRLNEDLTEAIALGHDLGHTPFGHDGEFVLNNLYEKGFRHSEQSVRVVEFIEKEGKGLNLTKEVRDGILCHSMSGQPARTLEGQVVRYSDKIAYINHDIEDAVRGGVLREADIPDFPVRILGRTKSERITTLIRSIIDNSAEKPTIEYGAEVQRAHDELRTFMFESVYRAPATNVEKSKACFIVEYFYKHFCEHPEEMPEFFRRVARDYETPLAVCDFVSGMTDEYAVQLFKDMCIPKGWSN